MLNAATRLFGMGDILFGVGKGWGKFALDAFKEG